MDMDHDDEPNSADEELVRLFVDQAAAWARANAARIGIAYHSDGGWELWLEVELYVWLTQHAPDLTVTRQAHSYAHGDSDRRADLLLDGRVVVELKAETSLESADAFAARVERDRAKVDGVDDSADSIDYEYEEGDAVAENEDGDAEETSGEDDVTPAAVVAFAFSTGGKGAVRALDVFFEQNNAGPLSIFWELTG
ncbi:hypothetical protein [Streptomyces specialis]|uniref:hypothetical protein n=1 Tax=Streptomyces specialis TaxID=498367 RepID=UPI00073E8FA2|nr:hypothetical protein [Streptomyces specialis]